MKTNRRDLEKGKGLMERVSRRLPDLKEENVLVSYDELDIDVVGEFSDSRLENVNILREEEQEVVEFKEESFQKAGDPAGIYFQEVGAFPLLTREGEIEIAKRIERGKKEILRGLLNFPRAV